MDNINLSANVSKPLADQSRRTFLKTTAVVGAAASVAKVPTLKAFKKKNEADKPASANGSWVASTCKGCTAWCAIEVFVQNGRLIKVRGNQHSKVNHGFVCPKGHLIPQQIYDPDRVKVPMKRTNPKKGKGEDPGFVPISWDEAMDTIATKMMELRNNNEPHKFAVFRGRYTSYGNPLLYNMVPSIFGSPNNISHSSICAETEKMGRYYTEGFFGYSDYDLENAECLVTWGVDPISSNRQIPNLIHRTGNLADKMTIINIDPKCNNTSVKSHLWLPIIPGQDGALAVAIAHYLLTQGLWSREFVGDFNDGINRFVAGQEVDEATFTEEHTFGLVKWWNLELKDKTPEWAEPICGIASQQIKKVAAEMGKAGSKCCIWHGPGPTMNPRGTYTALAIHALHGILGSVDTIGGTTRPQSSSAASFPADANYLDPIAVEGKKNKKIDQRGYLNMPAMASGNPGSGVVVNRVADAILDEDPYELKVAIGYWCNFNFSAQDTERWNRAMAKLPFFVHITVNAAEMTQFADIVLPAALSPERWGLNNNAGNQHSFISIMQPAIDRLWDVKSDENEITWLLAEKLADKGFSNLLDFYKTEFKDPETGATANTMEEFALISAKVRAARVIESTGSWENFKEVGIVNFGPFVTKKLWSNMPTVTKKFEFYSETMKKALTTHADKYEKTIDEVLEICNYTARGEYAFIPHYEPPLRWGDKNDYPFDFIDYKSKLNREGRSANCPWYYEFKKCDPGDANWDDVLKMNPDDADKLGLEDGDMVDVISQIGKISCKLRLWEGIRPGTVTKAFGQGHWAFGRVAAKDYNKFEARGANNNDIMPSDYDRLSGSSARNGGFTGVKVVKTGTSVPRQPKEDDIQFELASVYPNPMNGSGSLLITSTGDIEAKIYIVDMFGRNLKTINDGLLRHGSTTLHIEASDLPNGNYFVVCEGAGKIKSTKLIINR